MIKVITWAILLTSKLFDQSILAIKANIGEYIFWLTSGHDKKVQFLLLLYTNSNIGYSVT